jgi:hypothetical protein
MICSIGNRRRRWAGQYTRSVQRLQDPTPAISWMKDEAHLHAWVVSVGISARYVTHITNMFSRCMQYLRACGAYFRALVHFILKNSYKPKCEILYEIKEPVFICKIYSQMYVLIKLISAQKTCGVVEV